MSRTYNPPGLEQGREPSSPIIDYPIPVAQPKASARRPRRRRKRGFHGVKIVMADHYVEELRAVAQCMGQELRGFLYYALFHMMTESAELFGVSPRDLVNLSREQRRALAESLRSVNLKVALMRQS